jgi:hypothetical protein
LLNLIKPHQPWIKILQLDTGIIYHLASITPGPFAGQDVINGLGSLATRTNCIGQKAQSDCSSNGKNLGIRSLVHVVHSDEPALRSHRLRKKI